MKFIINKTISHTSDDRVLILEREEDYFKRGDLYPVKYFCDVVVKIANWEESKLFPIVSDTDSIQFRPKGIFRSSKGYFFKNANKKVQYLTPEAVDRMLDYISDAKKFLIESV